MTSPSSPVTDSDRSRTDAIFDALLADVDQFAATLADSARISDHAATAAPPAAPPAAAPAVDLNERVVKAKKSLPIPSPTKKTPPSLPAKSPAVRLESTSPPNSSLSLPSSISSSLSSSLSSSSSLNSSASAAVLSRSVSANAAGTTFKVHCASQYTVVKCAIPDASVSDLLALVKKKRALQASDAISPSKEYCLVRYGTFEILDPSTRLADLLLQHDDLQFAFDDVETVIARFSSAASDASSSTANTATNIASASTGTGGAVRGLPPSKASSARTTPATPMGAAATATSSSSSSSSTFGTMTFRNYFNTLAGGGSGGSSVDYTTPEYAFGTKAFNLVQNRATDNQTLLQGWLRKRRKGSKAPWRRRWIVLTGEQLAFYRVPDPKCTDIKVRQLRFAQLKRSVVDSASLVGGSAAAAADDETRLQFEVVFGVSGEDSGATFIFECANESEYEQWTAAITGRCEALILEAIDATPKSSSAQRLAAHAAEPGNDRCADCGTQPVEWASAKRGVTLCTQCSGVHRALGVQVSTVRSLTLDDWPTALLNEFVSFGGNRAVNALLESALPADLSATRDASTGDIVAGARDASEREAFARRKYEKFEFVADEKSAEWVSMTGGS